MSSTKVRWALLAVAGIWVLGAIFGDIPWKGVEPDVPGAEVPRGRVWRSSDSTEVVDLNGFAQAAAERASRPAEEDLLPKPPGVGRATHDMPSGDTDPKPMGTLEGVVLDRDGVGVPGLPLILQPDSRVAREARWRRSQDDHQFTADDGTFRFRAASDRRYLIFHQGVEGSESQQLLTPGGVLPDGGPLVLHLLGARIHVHVIDAQGEAYMGDLTLMPRPGDIDLSSDGQPFSEEISILLGERVNPDSEGTSPWSSIDGRRLGSGVWGFPVRSGVAYELSLFGNGEGYRPGHVPALEPGTVVHRTLTVGAGRGNGRIQVVDPAGDDEHSKFDSGISLVDPVTGRTLYSHARFLNPFDEGLMDLVVPEDEYEVVLGASPPSPNTWTQGHTLDGDRSCPTEFPGEFRERVAVVADEVTVVNLGPGAGARIRVEVIGGPTSEDLQALEAQGLAAPWGTNPKTSAPLRWLRVTATDELGWARSIFFPGPPVDDPEERTWRTHASVEWGIPMTSCELAPGRYRIRATTLGGRVAEGTVDAKGGETASVELRFP